MDEEQRTGIAAGTGLLARARPELHQSDEEFDATFDASIAAGYAASAT